MLQQKFYHSTIRKCVVAFGNMFNNITIDRKDANGVVVQSLKIPLSYAPQQPFLAKILQQPVAEDAKVQVTLPRMSFEMVGVSYDPSRKVSPLQQNKVRKDDGSMLTQYAPAPYNVDMMLYVYSKNQDDALQIVEQILPYFNPEYTLSLRSIPQLGINNDLPIILNSVSYEDDYEGDFTQRRMIMWNLSFSLKMNFFGPVNRQGYITNSIASTFTDFDLEEYNTEYSVTSPSLPTDLEKEYIETIKDNT